MEGQNVGVKIDNERLYYGGPLRRAPWWQRPGMAVRRWRGRRQLNNWVVLGATVKRHTTEPLDARSLKLIPPFHVTLRNQARLKPGPCLCELVPHPFCRVVTCRCDHGI